MAAAREHWTARRVEEQLSGLRESAIPLAERHTDPLLWSYVDAASVLSSFDPELLAPIDPNAPRVEALRRLLHSSIPVFGEDGHARWRLTATCRRVALERLATSTRILEACRSNPKPEDPLRTAFEQILHGAAGAYRDATGPELARLLEAARALDGIVPVPDIAAVERAVEADTLLQPLRALVGTRFRGREKELARLREYVGLDVRPGRRRLRRAPDERRPLLVYGTGGIGKSTLLAKLILDHGHRTRGLVFAYLDFDRPAVTGADPSSIVLELARQIAVQSDTDTQATWERFIAVWTARLLEQRRASPPGTDGGADSVSPGALGTLTRAFADSYASSLNGGRPLVLVLDSFEEVQYRSTAQVAAVWALVQDLQAQVPALRAILAGRAPIEGHETESLELPALDKDAAVGFLEAHGITDSDTATMMIARFGTSPLTLSLAADLVHREGAGGQALLQLTKRQRLGLFAVDHRAAQVELYRRLLRHLHEDSVRRLAHPGLVLRRITPELIKDVLAGPCEVDVPSDERARELFEKLRSEITLVRPTDDGALEHRSDLRRAMLPMLRETEPQAVAAIHASAIEYFSRSDRTVDRAEEIYHRLAAGQDPAEVEGRWMDGVEDRLRGSVGELPPRAQTFLAARTGVEIDPEMWKLASREDREQRAQTQARELLALGRAQDALVVLREVVERESASRVALLEAEAYRDLGMFQQGLDTIDTALNTVPGRGAGESARDLLTLAAMIEQALGRREPAAERIDEAYDVARWLEDNPALLGTAAHRLRLCRAARKDDERRYLRAIRDVHRDIAAMDGEVLAGQPAAAHRVAAELAANYPEDLARVSRAAGLPQLRARRVRQALVLWNREQRGALQDDAAAERVISGSGELSAATAMDVLLGVLARHPVPAAAAGSIGSEVRHALAQAGAPEGGWVDDGQDDEDPGDP